MPDEFGTPDAHDATALSERAVIEAANADVSLDKSVKESLTNRPLGSVKISPQQQKQEFDSMKDDDQHLAQFFVDNKMTVEQTVQYLTKMNK